MIRRKCILLDSINLVTNGGFCIASYLSLPGHVILHVATCIFSISYCIRQLVQC